MKRIQFNTLPAWPRPASLAFIITLVIATGCEKNESQDVPAPAVVPATAPAATQSTVTAAPSTAATPESFNKENILLPTD